MSALKHAIRTPIVARPSTANCHGVFTSGIQKIVIPIRATAKIKATIEIAYDAAHPRKPWTTGKELSGSDFGSFCSPQVGRGFPANVAAIVGAANAMLRTLDYERRHGHTDAKRHRGGMAYDDVQQFIADVQAADLAQEVQMTTIAKTRKREKTKTKARKRWVHKCRECRGEGCPACNGEELIDHGKPASGRQDATLDPAAFQRSLGLGSGTMRRHGPGDAARHNAALAAADLAPQPPTVVDVEASAPMTKAEQKELGALERQIEANLAGFVEVGQCLARIRDGRLYRQSHGSFDAYCADRWDFRRAHAYRLIDAAAVVERLSPNGDAAAVVPDRESYARPLSRVDPDQQKEVWQQIVAAAPRVADKPKISAKLVERKVQEWLTPGDEADARQAEQTQRREAAKEANVARDKHRFAELLAQFRAAAGKVVDEFPDKKHRVRLAESLRDLAACVENGEPF